MGASSGAQATVKSITLATGTWGAGSAAGVITLKNQIGTFTSENIKVGAGTDDATVGDDSTAISTYYPFSGALAKVAMIQVVDNTALVCWDGSKPDQTLKKGLHLPNLNGIVVTGQDSIQRFKCVDLVSGAASILNVICFF